MSCREAVPEIVEAVRACREPQSAVRAHIARCAGCASRLQAESELASHFRLIRASASARRSSRGSRDDLMREFRSRHRRLIHPAWAIPLAAAAALFIVMAVLRGPFAFAPKPSHSAPANGAWLASSSWSVEPATDASLAQDSTYTPVPYAPPLAPGERLSVMHAELYPAALTSFGVSVDPAELAYNGNATVHADVVVGEDGLPRAIRLNQADQPVDAQSGSADF